MKKFLLINLVILNLYTISVLAQQQDSTIWIINNRNVQFGNEIYLNSKPGSGFVFIKDSDFSNGVIELDLKGKNEKGRSFIGIAFHGQNDSTYEAVYFRPFNFLNHEKVTHSIQYIYHPKFKWYNLRNDFPQKYESNIHPIPNPDDWFHIKLLVEYPIIKVFINHSENSSFEIEELSPFSNGWIGLWVGNNSDGYFRNLKITPCKQKP